MDRYCFVIALLCLDIADNIGQIILDVLQVRIARQKCFGASRQEFKFRIGSITTIYGGVRITTDRILFQAVKKRQICLIRFKPSQYTEIRKGLIHDHNKVWRLGGTGMGCQHAIGSGNLLIP